MIILVAGLPGSGKSYFAEQLAARLEAAYINSDKTRTILHASGRYSFDDKLEVYKEMLTEVIKSIEASDDVVVDATFYHHTMREMFVRLAQGYNLELRVIEVVADESLVRQRLQQPRKYSEADFSVYEKVRDDFEEIVMPHLILQSTNDNLQEMLKESISYIRCEGT